ncbi:hypothetical protein COCSADRAFT_31888 [Bipolaris sorokiniana ND90Pr]|uniref:Uncharacterized protein n=1 Tax=Cochliobolus sativus (strain ND90Pr / ATCC 201652) TaxID=665912 RepID=M2RRD6_COCSN|nr:uncharacterized protein COCSADRAFT_31888 [Bipolaris sorokiniana ND90Pr]EMD69124.1 hypothetical protein COCSADRAFT_31888 [Bipolaris sorokiniana ND90Pr]
MPQDKPQVQAQAPAKRRHRTVYMTLPSPLSKNAPIPRKGRYTLNSTRSKSKTTQRRKQSITAPRIGLDLRYIYHRLYLNGQQPKKIVGPIFICFFYFIFWGLSKLIVKDQWPWPKQRKKAVLTTYTESSGSCSDL